MITLAPLPTNALWDCLKVVVGDAEDLEVVHFANACWDTIEVNLVAVDIQLAETCQSTQ